MVRRSQLKNTFFNLENQKSVKTIYIRGEFISNDLVKEFKQEGYFVNEIINYTTELNHSFEDEIKTILLNQSIDIIFLYSIFTVYCRTQIVMELCRYEC